MPALIELALDDAPNASFSRTLEHVMVFDSPKLLQVWLYDPEKDARTRHVLSALPRRQLELSHAHCARRG